MKNSELDKRTRLLEAANKLVHQQGFNQTTLADIALESKVPLGNMYYYFKTKDDLGHALIEHRTECARDQLSEWDKLPEPPGADIGCNQSGSRQSRNGRTKRLSRRQSLPGTA